MKKQPAITNATRNAFVDSYCELAAEDPDKKITVRQITEEAGYNRTTFYRYFEDVTAIRDYLEDTIIRTLTEKMKSHLATGTIDDSFFRIFLDMFRENKTRLVILLHDQNRTHFIQKIKNNLLPVTRSLYKADVSDPRPAVTVNIYLSGVFAAMADWLKDPASISEDELLSIIQELFESWVLPLMNE